MHKEGFFLSKDSFCLYLVQSVGLRALTPKVLLPENKQPSPFLERLAPEPSGLSSICQVTVHSSEIAQQDSAVAGLSTPA